VASSLAHHHRLRFGKLPLLSRAQLRVPIKIFGRYTLYISSDLRTVHDRRSIAIIFTAHRAAPAARLAGADLFAPPDRVLALQPGDLPRSTADRVHRRLAFRYQRDRVDESSVDPAVPGTTAPTRHFSIDPIRGVHPGERDRAVLPMH